MNVCVYSINLFNPLFGGNKAGFVQNKNQVWKNRPEGGSLFSRFYWQYRYRLLLGQWDACGTLKILTTFSRCYIIIV